MHKVYRVSLLKFLAWGSSCLLLGSFVVVQVQSYHTVATTAVCGRSLGSSTSQSFTPMKHQGKQRHSCVSLYTKFRLSEWNDEDESRTTSSDTNYNFGSNELSDEDEALIRLIRGPLGAAVQRPRPKAIIILSDTTGVTAKAAVEKSLVQFNGCDERFTQSMVTTSDDDDRTMTGSTDEDDEECENLTTQIFPFVQREQDIAKILRQVAERHCIMKEEQTTKNIGGAVIVFTLTDPGLRESTARMCELSCLLYVDLLGPMFDCMSIFFQRQPIGVSSTPPTDSLSSLSSSSLSPRSRRRVKLSDDYFRRIEAVEYTLKCDDGMNPNLLHQADVILLGVSRTGKTPLSVVLAQTMGLKVANVPLVLDLPPPKQLFARRNSNSNNGHGSGVNSKRVFVLTLNPDDLLKIRKTRLERELSHFSSSSSSAVDKRKAMSNKYADRQYLLADLNHARQIALEHDFTEIDVTGRAVEETASLVRSLLNDRFGENLIA